MYLHEIGLFLFKKQVSVWEMRIRWLFLEILSKSIYDCVHSVLNEEQLWDEQEADQTRD